MFSNKAQAGLEYLMTYGWTLVFIAAVVGVLVFIVGTPAQEAQFTTSNPDKLLLKSDAVSGGEAKAALQNITGGRMVIDGIIESGVLSGCTIEAGGLTGDSGIAVGAGETMLLECAYSGSGAGSATINYTNFSNLAQTAVISVGGGTGGGGTAVECGDGECNGAETCETCPADCGACPPEFNPLTDCSGKSVGQVCLTEGTCGTVNGSLLCLGPELLQNATFSTTTDWWLDGACGIYSDLMNCNLSNGSTGSFTQNMAVPLNMAAQYKLTLDIDSWNETFLDTSQCTITLSSYSDTLELFSYGFYGGWTDEQGRLNIIFTTDVQDPGSNLSVSIYNWSDPSPLEIAFNSISLVEILT